MARGRTGTRRSQATQEAPAGAFLVGAGELREFESASPGEVLRLADGREVTVGSQIGGNAVGRLGVPGLDEVVSVTPQGARVAVGFTSGATAHVTLATRQASCDCGQDICRHRVAALYEALALVEPKPGHRIDPAIAAHQQALAAYHDDPSDLAKLAAAAATGERALLALGPMQVEAAALAPAQTPGARASAGLNAEPIAPPMSEALFAATAAPPLHFDPAEVEEDPLRAILTRLAKRKGDADMLKALDKAKGVDALLEIYESKRSEPGFPKSDHPINLAVRLAGAEREGLWIPQPDRGFLWTQELARCNALVRSSLGQGDRTFGLYGDPGTGKNSYAYELAAAFGMPVYEVDFSEGVDMDQLLGTTGLAVERGDDGGVATKTVAELGPLARAAKIKGGSVIVLNEIVEAGKGQLTALHNAIGSGSSQHMETDEEGNAVFRPRERFITVKTPAGGETTVEVDPNTIFVLTWNPGRESRMPHEAMLSRTLCMRFGYGTEREETERQALNVYTRVHGLYQDQPYKPGLTKTDNNRPVPVPISEQIPDLSDEVKKDVRLARELRQMYYNGDIDIYPDARLLTRFSGDRIELMNRAKDDPNPAARLHALKAAASQLTVLFDQSYQMEEIHQQLDNILANHYTEIQDDLGGRAR